MNNSEWYYLFRDEIRNSIVIEGVFANRIELLSVLIHGRVTPALLTKAMFIALLNIIKVNTAIEKEITLMALS
ncbi:MAG: hypothetical protein IIB44_11115 [Candidatus Marinimicrobia bacterium]|nr:hypothetical protein [Candidatus Neomarinimicrobiota bacterium]MCH8068122.1 hypothetical protein [Candidatus Neomarinimicrobiota bacterium]